MEGSSIQMTAKNMTSVKKAYSSGDRKQHMNIVLTFSQYAAVLTKFNSIIGSNFGGEAGVFGGNLPPPPSR